jgi:hypothetical protein
MKRQQNLGLADHMHRTGAAGTGLLLRLDDLLDPRQVLRQMATIAFGLGALLDLPVSVR